MRLSLTKYGRREWILSSLLLAGGMGVSIYLARPQYAWSAVALVPLAIVWGWVLWFFRDPQRTPPEGPALVSPADGRVTDVTVIGPDSPLGVEGIRLGIFMSVFDVHVNRSAAAGSVKKIEHRVGTFLDVRNAAGWEQNESVTIYLSFEQSGRNYPIVLRQIAGLVARRIVTDLQVGQTVARGQRIGMIKFGSRMEVLVPRELGPRALVAIGQHVSAGQTPIIALASSESP